uniref:Uncharacterized protein n=1 Tax=Nelumbo nucifera TaxID=4432 RepID=A0A822Y605_NELNU|nr:TPA_asm: hypothetical protein HUJ06_027943 [Nelumbo nucifera]
MGFQWMECWHSQPNLTDSHCEVRCL